MVLLTADGLHEPFMPLSEIVGKDGTLAPAQIASVLPKLKIGVTFGLTVTVSDAVVAHCPAVGVNVYVAEF